MIYEIVTEPNQELHQVCDPVVVFDDNLAATITNMRETMHAKRGMGLAAPQVGLKQRLVVIEYVPKGHDDDAIPFTALINPRITWSSPDQIVMTEGCLSLPNLEGEVKRPKRVRVKAQAADGTKIELRASGLFARILQHEIDHLDGILYSDRMAPGTKPTPVKEA